MVSFQTTRAEKRHRWTMKGCSKKRVVNLQLGRERWRSKGESLKPGPLLGPFSFLRMMGTARRRGEGPGALVVPSVIGVMADGKAPSWEVQETSVRQHHSRAAIPASESHKTTRSTTSLSHNPVQNDLTDGETEAQGTQEDRAAKTSSHTLGSSLHPQVAA